MTLADHRTLESFFYDELESLSSQSELPEDVGAYVVSLLARFARRTGVAGRKSRALALQYLSARQSTGSARKHALRGVGDRALYISGVVPRSLHRTPVNLRYVRSIGESAYREVATPEGPLSVFGTLAHMFKEVSEVISDIVEPAQHEAPADLLGLYERWRKHGDPRDAKRLIRAGVLLDTTGLDEVQ